MPLQDVCPLEGQHPANLSAKLFGPSQGAQRAELRAFVYVASIAWRRTNYITDSQLVVDIYDALWCKGSLQPFPYQDLIHRLRAACQAKGTDFVRATKTQGHAKFAPDDAANQEPWERELAFMKCINDEADNLAVAGAKLHKIPSQLASACKARHKLTIDMQLYIEARLEKRHDLAKQLKLGPKFQLKPDFVMDSQAPQVPPP